MAAAGPGRAGRRRAFEGGEGGKGRPRRRNGAGEGVCLVARSHVAPELPLLRGEVRGWPEGSEPVAATPAARAGAGAGLALPRDRFFPGEWRLRMAERSRQRREGVELKKVGK